jgi:hypothetical protein
MGKTGSSMTLRRDDDYEVRELLALRPTDDLTDDELRRVDESLRYSDVCRRELAEYEQCMAVLNAAGAEPSPTDDRPSLWSRIEPKLGPARKYPPRRWITPSTTSWLTAAVLLLAVGNIYFLVGGLQGDAKPVNMVQMPPVIPNAGDLVGGNMLVGNRFPVLVDPRDERGRVRPLLGIFVLPCEDDRKGAVIAAIFSGTSAEDAGLQVGDILLSIDGKEIAGPGCVIGCLRRHGVGQKIEVAYLREGREHKVNVFLGGLMKLGDMEVIIKKSTMPLDLIETP